MRRFFLTVAVLAVVAIPCASQSPQPPIFEAPQSNTIIDQSESGSITGTVLDRTGATVVGARVTLKHEDQTLDILSGPNGQFSFTNIAPGDYSVTISANSFASQTSTGTLHSGEAVIVPTITLAPAEATANVQVVASQNDIAEAQIKMQEKQRIIGVFPNFYISYIPDAVPLSSKQKFKLASRTMIDPVTFALTGVTAGVQQWQGDYSGYGQGAQGFAKRFGANYTDNATDTYIAGAILPSLLHQDPRYFYKGTGSTKARLLYAIGTLFVCKGDNKHWQPNYSGLLGGLASGGISNLYYPPQDRGASLTFNNFFIGMGTAAGVNVLQEFVIKKFTPNTPSNNSSKP